MPSLYIIDAHAYLHRAYHALPPLTTSKGEPVNAIYGFLRMLNKILKQYRPDAMAVCFDSSAPTFRHEAFKDYKATRKEIDTALVSQFPIARDAVAALNLAAFELPGYEADDLIAQLTRKARERDYDVVVVSGDKDILQLVGEGVKVLNEPKDVLFDAEKVVEKWGVSPHQLADVLALMGDSSDNVPGVPGIGEKTAVKLIQEHGSLEKLLSVAATIKGKTGQLLQEHEAQARQSFSLVTLHPDVPIDINWEKCTVSAPDADALTAFLQRMEFFAMIKDLVPAGSAAPVDTSDRDYLTITTAAQLEEWVRGASKAERLAVDVETDSLDPLHANLVGISMAHRPGAACYIPVGHRVLDGTSQLPLADVVTALRPLLNSGTPKIYGHNLKFDAMVLERHGLSFAALTFDSMVASYVLNPGRNSHGLKDLVLEWVGQRMTPIEELIGKGAKQTTMDEVPIDRVAPYACADADMSLRLADRFEGLIKEKGLEKLFFDMEMPLVAVLQDLEKVGIRVDAKYLESLGHQIRERAQALEKEIYAHAGETFNIGSPKQLAVILFDKLKLPVIRRTKTGISTDEEVLTKLSDQHPLPKTLIDYRELQKLHSTYIVGLQEAMDAKTSRVHTSFNQTVAATGRLSSSNPNLQNIPIRTELGRQIRKAFIPADGHVLLSADYSQIDLRMLAHISGDPVLVEAFRKGEDVHTTTAAEIFGVARDQVTKDLRRVAKSINFGIVYGISAFGLSQQLQIPAEEAKSHIQRYFERYPGVRAWIDKTLDEARRDGYVRTLLGRIRYLPEIQSKNIQMRNFAERMAMNTPIQGTSADVIKLAMLALARAQRQGTWTGAMLLQVHDELVFELPQDEATGAMPKIKRLMEDVLALSIPIVVDLKAGANWAEMKPVDLAQGVA